MHDIDKIRAYWASWINGNVKIVPNIIENTPELNDLLHTPQSRSLHAEGSVARHTILCCEAINEILEVVPSDQRTILRLAVLLHDIAKPECIIEAAPGIYSFPEANRLSSCKARLLLEKYTKISFKDKESVLALINNHVVPLYLIKKGRPIRELQKVSLECNLQTLYNLVKVNYIGRTSLNMRERFEEIETFKKWCIQQDYWNGKIWKGLLDLEAYMSYGKNAYVAKSIIDWFYLFGAVDDYSDAQNLISSHNNWQWGTLIMTVGLPASGKSTWVKDNYPMLNIVSSDDIKEELSVNKYDKEHYNSVNAIADKKIDYYLSRGAQVVYDAPNVTFERRKVVIDRARALGANIIIINFATPYEICLSRIKAKINPSVTPNDLHNLALDYDYVSVYECNKLVYV
ncbi:MAG: AAA family ATPase [Vampirovibrionia bacterium]